MDAAGQIIKAHANLLVEEATFTIADDIPKIIAQKEQLSSPDEIGSELQAVIPQEKFRIRQLRIMGRPESIVDIPRWNTGLMQGSITPHLESGRGIVDMGSFDEDVAWDQQAGNAGYEWGHGKNKQFYGPIPARPFFGVSARALNEIDAAVEKHGKDIESEFERMVIEPITVQLSV